LGSFLLEAISKIGILVQDPVFATRKVWLRRGRRGGAEFFQLGMAA